MRESAFKTYWEMLDGAGPAYKEMVLAAAAKDKSIDLAAFARLKTKADFDLC